jgi:hypothetical protein
MSEDLLSQIIGSQPSPEERVINFLLRQGFNSTCAEEPEFGKVLENGEVLVVSKDADRSGKWFVFRLKGERLLPPDGRVRSLVRVLRRLGMRAEALREGSG